MHIQRPADNLVHHRSTTTYGSRHLHAPTRTWTTLLAFNERIGKDRITPSNGSIGTKDPLVSRKISPPPKSYLIATYSSLEQPTMKTTIQSRPSSQLTTQTPQHELRPQRLSPRHQHKTGIINASTTLTSATRLTCNSGVIDA